MPKRDVGLGSLDLRSLPACSTPVTPDGYGLFVLSERVPTAGYYLGSLLGRTLTSAEKQTIKTVLEVGENIVADTLLEILWELLTLHADPTGQTRSKPLMPAFNGLMELYLGGFSLVKSKLLVPFVSDEWPLVVATLQNDYRRIRQEVLSGQASPGLHRKVLSAWVAKYGLPWETFVPKGLPLEPPLRFDTTIKEGFTQADSDTLGPDLSWTEFDNTNADLDVVSNACERSGPADPTPPKARADTDLSSNDHYSQIVILNPTAGDKTAWETHVRRTSTATLTYYHFDWLHLRSDVNSGHQTFHAAGSPA